MNWLDYVFIGILAISVIISIFRGLTKEVLSLLIWVVAFWLAYHYVDIGAKYLESYIELPSARHLIAFVAILIAALFLGSIINFILGKLIKSTGLSGTDRFFGMFFGLLRGVVIIIVIAFFVRATPLSEDPWWQNSKLVPYAGKIAEWARVRMPESFSKYFSFIENNKVVEQTSEMLKKAAENVESSKQLDQLMQSLSDNEAETNEQTEGGSN